MSNRTYKRYLIVTIIFSILTLLPLIILSFYNHPSADDFSFAKWNNNIWVDTHSLIAVLKNALWTSGYFWNNSQGTYTSAFIMSLQPAMFGEKYYAVTGFINIGALLFANIMFMFALRNSIMKITKLETTALGVVVATMMIQWMPSGVSGMYWYNGSMHYTVAFCMFLFMISLSIYVDCAKRKFTYIAYSFFTSVLAFLLAGENYVTAFAGILFLSGMLLFKLIKRKGRIWIGKVIPLAFNVCGLLLNALSPGTRKRQANILNRPGVVKTIWFSFFKGCEYINSWFNLSKVVCIMLMLPLLYRCVKMLKSRGFNFKWPLVFTILSVGYIGALFCPPYYAMGSEGSGRLTNVIYFTFILLLFANITYWMGWIVVHADGVQVRNILFRRYDSKHYSYFMAVLLSALVCFGITKAHAFTAAKSLLSGEAAIYSKECYERDDMLENMVGKDVIVVSYSVRPTLLYFDDISDNPEDWRNRAMTLYYRLNSVKKE